MRDKIVCAVQGYLNEYWQTVVLPNAHGIGRFLRHMAIQDRAATWVHLGVLKGLIPLKKKQNHETPIAKYLLLFFISSQCFFFFFSFNSGLAPAVPSAPYPPCSALFAPLVVRQKIPIFSSNSMGAERVLSCQLHDLSTMCSTVPVVASC